MAVVASGVLTEEVMEEAAGKLKELRSGEGPTGPFFFVQFLLKF